MDPYRETRLWSYEYSPVYERYDAIFDCRGHGWSNLQSMHVNLPFSDDAEFERLHAAIRMALPILPALAASSPVFDARPQRLDDGRMGFYREHTRRVPSLIGAVVPERVWTRESYEAQILGRIYADLAPFDPQGVLRQEFSNARGAIARFDRHAIEIRVLDTQECAAMDLAVAEAVVALVEALVAERWTPLARQKVWEEERLARILWRTVESSTEARISDPEYLRALGMDGAHSATAGELWRHLCDELLGGSDSAAMLSVILEQGSLSRRIRGRLGRDPKRKDLFAVYGELCSCLQEGRPFPLGI
jgi:gamma-glutamyl:cysteine ligase YbdK (ATP-grasp superfamily)